MSKTFHRIDRDRLLSLKKGDTLGPDEFPTIEDAFRITGEASPTRWFVVQCNPNCEGRAETGLGEIGGDVYMPRFTRWKSIPPRQQGPRGARREPMVRPLFPGYVFLGWSWDGEPPWLKVRRVDGVRAILWPVDVVRFTMLVLGLRAEELAGELDACAKKPKRFSIGRFAPQFIAMTEADRVRDLMRRMRGVEPERAAA